MATAISLLVHAAILAALVAGTGIFMAGRNAGPGDTVSVWIEVPEGAAALQKRSDGPATTKSRAERMGRLDAERVESPAERSGAMSRSDGAGGGSAEGGVGLPGGDGAGGSPLLSKIWRRINSSKYYPASARRRGLAGMPSVTFAIGEDGNVKWVKLARSSGTAILDDAALATVRRAAPLPYYPKPITVAVKYSIGE